MPDNAANGPIAVCTCGRLRMAARRISRIYDRHLAPTGIGIAQFGLLSAVAKNDGASVTALASLLEMERTTLTRNLQPLEREGLVAVGPGTDHRTRSVKITDGGRAVLKQARPLWAAAQRAVLAALGEEATHALHTALELTLQRVPEA